MFLNRGGKQRLELLRKFRQLCRRGYARRDTWHYRTDEIIRYLEKGSSHLG